MNKFLNKIRTPFSYNYSNFTLYIIIACGIIFFVNLIAQMSGKNTNIAVFYLGLVPELIKHGFIWQFVTYMFVHGGFYHLFFNMLALFFFGIPVERRFGSSEFTLFYFTVGILCGIFSFIIYNFISPTTPIIGASGAIYGVLLAFAALYPDERIYIFAIFPIKAYVLILVYFFVEIFSSLNSINSGVANLTHLAGLIIGYFYLWIRKGINPGKVFLNSFRNRRR